ncbi:MAG: hypothetical protein AAGH38_11825 [Pseudomonadota bacterium]
MAQADKQFIENWLGNASYEHRIAIVSRVALRRLPEIADSQNPLFQLRLLSVLRTALTACVAARLQGSNIKGVARRAAHASDKADTEGSKRSTDAALLVNWAALAVTDHDNEQSYPIRTVRMLNYQEDIAVALDIECLSTSPNASDVFFTPLWNGEDVPSETLSAFDVLGSFWLANYTTWQFWRRWYQCLLSGDRISWDVQFAVAMIPDEDWEAGPERVAARIREIEDDFSAVRSQTDRSRLQAERLLSRAAMHALTAQETAKLIQSAVSINSLPAEFDGLRATPAILFAMAATLQTHAKKVASLEGDLQTSQQSVHALARKVAELEDNIGALTRELERAKGKSKRELFGEVAVSTSAKILTTAFWGTLLAGIGYLAGYVDIADLLDRLHNAVTEPPVGPLDEGESWEDPSVDV